MNFADFHVPNINLALLIFKCYFVGVNLPRRIKPDPNDPTWTFPYASRKRIEKLRWYMERRQKGVRGNFRASSGRRHKVILSPNRPNPVPWESVPPQYRQRCEELFNRKVALEMAKGIPGWPTPGKINSIRMNCANAGRHYFNGENFFRYSHYKQKKKMWILYQTWLLDQEKAQFDGESEVTKHKILEVA